ncbi:GDSL esterase/lipase [Sesamum angolense]|uniref:GDSL esterase/lipase n=1 Tax=Sesamum angolense TaxID=2727404 RepID=A0AAE1W0V9_9LAMI|nr:GDSL esterase/lipase [Sesamum angolense]
MAVVYAITVLILVAASSKSASGCFDSIISFGDSLADTGNLLLLRHPATRPHLAALPTANFLPPPHRKILRRPSPESLGLPFVEPYFAGEPAAEKGGRFSKGVNFAVAAATALENGFLEKRGIHNPFTNVSLETQLHWFKQFVATIPVLY